MTWKNALQASLQRGLTDEIPYADPSTPLTGHRTVDAVPRDWALHRTHDAGMTQREDAQGTPLSVLRLVWNFASGCTIILLVVAIRAANTRGRLLWLDK